MATPTRLTISDSPRHRPVSIIVRERTTDRKLTTDHRARPVAVTMASQHSCPASCPFMNAGCYAETGNMRFSTGRLNAYGERAPEAIAADEAAGIRALSGENPLRLHVVGDAKTDEAAAELASASAEYHARHDQPVWTYTHAWRTVDRASWGNVSVLASCESPAEVQEALDRGYATAMVAPDADSIPERIAGTKPVVCPQQTGAQRDCESCRLCTHDQRLRGKATVVFLAHGNTRQVRSMLATRQ